MTRWVIVPEKIYTTHIKNIKKVKVEGKRIISGIIDEPSKKRKAELGGKTKNKKTKITKRAQTKAATSKDSSCTDSSTDP
jgi:hypothetical protein